MQTPVKFTRVNEIDAMYGRSRVSDDYTLKLNLAQLLGLRVTFYTLSLFYLRAYARKNDATVEINLESASQNTGEPMSLSKYCCLSDKLLQLWS